MKKPELVLGLDNMKNEKCIHNAIILKSKLFSFFRNFRNKHTIIWIWLQ